MLIFIHYLCNNRKPHLVVSLIYLLLHFRYTLIACKVYSYCYYHSVQSKSKNNPPKASLSCLYLFSLRLRCFGHWYYNSYWNLTSRDRSRCIVFHLKKANKGNCLCFIICFMIFLKKYAWHYSLVKYNKELAVLTFINRF